MIVNPEFVSLKNWSAALVIDFPSELLPILTDENKWQEWAAIVVTTGIFSKYGLPSPYVVKNGIRDSRFREWKEWAKVVYMSLINEPPIQFV